MIRLLTTLLAFTICALPLHADEQVSNFTLENGMEVVVIEDHRAPIVVNMVWYRAGSADETEGQSGAAHYLEHLLFKGTDTLAPGEFSATVAKNGGTDNAFTSYDYTAYFQRVAADRLELMIRMEADRMVNLRLDNQDISTEREVVIEERNQRTDSSPNALFNEHMNAITFPNHRYGVPVIGWRREIETLDLDSVLSFYKRYYAPNNAILVVSGDVEPEAVLALANTYFGPLPANPELTPRARAEQPAIPEAKRTVYVDARVAQPYVARTYLAPERNKGDQKAAATLTLLADILGGANTSVLNEKLQFDSQIAVYTGAWYSALSLDKTTFDLIVVPTEGVTLQNAEDALDATLEGFFRDGVDADQLARLKTQYRASAIYARDDVNGLANRYGRALTQGLTVADVQAWPDVLQSVTGEEILAAAKQIFRPEASVTGWLVAKEEGNQ